MRPNPFTRKDNPNTSSRMGRCGTNWNENIVWHSSNQHNNKNIYHQDNHYHTTNEHYYKNNDADHNYQQSPDQSNRRCRQCLYRRYRTRKLRRPVQLRLQIRILSSRTMYLHWIRSTSSCAALYRGPWSAAIGTRQFVFGIVQFCLRSWVLSADCVSGCLGSSLLHCGWLLIVCPMGLGSVFAFIT